MRCWCANGPSWIRGGNLRAQLSADVGSGLAFAHWRGVWHRNVRAAACVVSHEWRAKLTDFAHAKTHDGAVETAGVTLLDQSGDEECAGRSR